MMLTGTIDKIDCWSYVKYSYLLLAEPTRQTMWWRVERVESTCGALVCSPAVGDTVTRLDSSNAWVGPGYRAYTVEDAGKVERTPVPCPKVGRRQARWNDGRWEKLLAKGWVPA